MVSTFLTMLCMMASTDPGAKSELLPKTPPDWRFERIDFPLDFAPDLKYEGFEELRFAPGMFDDKSDTYFTYIFAMKITSEVSFDAKRIKSLLETYFRGLCRTVSKNTEFKIDTSKISATVREDHYEAQNAKHFTVTLDSFDPFVTGKPLKLRIEIIAHIKSKTDHRIFAAVSPKASDSPIWKQLRKLKKQFRVQ